MKDTITLNTTIEANVPDKNGRIYPDSVMQQAYLQMAAKPVPVYSGQRDMNAHMDVIGFTVTPPIDYSINIKDLTPREIEEKIKDSVYTPGKIAIKILKGKEYFKELIKCSVISTSFIGSINKDGIVEDDAVLHNVTLHQEPSEQRIVVKK